jgi:hypothetical protein
MQPFEQFKRNFTFYFGKFTLNPLKYCTNSLNMLCNVPSTNDLIDVGIKSKNGQYDLNAKERSDGNCVKTAFSNMCMDIHQTGDKKRLLIIHEMPITIAQVYNQFGMTKMFHLPIISYENEVLGNFIYKIVEDLDPEARFYYTVLIFQTIKCT